MGKTRISCKTLVFGLSVLACTITATRPLLAGPYDSSCLPILQNSTASSDSWVQDLERVYSDLIDLYFSLPKHRESLAEDDFSNPLAPIFKSSDPLVVALNSALRAIEDRIEKKIEDLEMRQVIISKLRNLAIAKIRERKNHYDLTNNLIEQHAVPSKPIFTFETEEPSIGIFSARSKTLIRLTKNAELETIKFETYDDLAPRIVRETIVFPDDIQSAFFGYGTSNNPHFAVDSTEDTILFVKGRLAFLWNYKNKTVLERFEFVQERIGLEPAIAKKSLTRFSVPPRTSGRGKTATPPTVQLVQAIGGKGRFHIRLRSNDRYGEVIVADSSLIPILGIREEPQESHENEIKNDKVFWYKNVEVKIGFVNGRFIVATLRPEGLNAERRRVVLYTLAKKKVWSIPSFEAAIFYSSSVDIETSLNHLAWFSGNNVFVYFESKSNRITTVDLTDRSVGTASPQDRILSPHTTDRFDSLLGEVNGQIYLFMREEGPQNNTLVRLFHLGSNVELVASVTLDINFHGGTRMAFDADNKKILILDPHENALFFLNANKDASFDVNRTTLSGLKDLTAFEAPSYQGNELFIVGNYFRYPDRMYRLYVIDSTRTSF